MTPRNVAFLIGIDHFSDKSFTALRFCQNDVTGMARVLSDPAISNFDVIEVRNKRHDEVLERLERTVGRLSPGDKLLFYFAGHGRRSPQSGRLYLVAADTKSDALRSTAIPVDSTLDIIRESRCDNRALVLDCCYSGAIGEGFRGGDAASGLESLAEKNKGTYILTASTGIELAAEREIGTGRDEGHGVFTKYFIEALESGQATTAGSDEITIDAVHDYIQERVIKDAAQQPQRFVIGGTGRFVLGHSSASRWESLRPQLKRRVSELLSQNVISDEQCVAALVLCRASWTQLTPEQKNVARSGMDALANKTSLSEFLNQARSAPDVRETYPNHSVMGANAASIDRYQKKRWKISLAVAAVLIGALIIGVFGWVTDFSSRWHRSAESSNCQTVPITDFSKNPPVHSTTTVCD